MAELYREAPYGVAGAMSRIVAPDPQATAIVAAVVRALHNLNGVRQGVRHIDMWDAMQPCNDCTGCWGRKMLLAVRDALKEAGNG